MQNECDVLIRIKKMYLDLATGALSKENIPFEVNGKTKHLPSKINGFDAKMDFAKSMGCTSISKAIDKCGSRYQFELKFAAWQN